MKTLALALAFCAPISVALAQGGMQPGPGTPHTAGGGSYTGPGDVVSGAFYWVGLRAYNAAVAATGTQKAIKVRRASDNTTLDILILTSGALNNAAAITFAGTDATGNATSSGTAVALTGLSGAVHVGDTIAGTGFVGSYCTAVGSFAAGAQTCTTNTSQTIGVAEAVTLTWGLYAATLYDQSGNGIDFTQATTANQPQLFFSGCTSGSLACLSFTSSQSLIAANQAGVTYPGSVELVSNRTGDFSSFDNAFFNNIATLTYWNTTNSIKFRLATGDVNMAATDNAWHCIQGVGSATVAATSLDGVYNLVGNGGTSGPTVTPDIGNFTGMIVEAGEWNTTAFTSANTTSMNTNVHTYWGF